MSRNDGMLYSGASSASLQPSVSLKQQALKAEKLREREAKKQEVQPIAEPVMNLIQKYKDQADSISTLNADVPELHLKANVMATQKNIKFIETFEQELKDIMRAHNL